MGKQAGPLESLRLWQLSNPQRQSPEALQQLAAVEEQLPGEMPTLTRPRDRGVLYGDPLPFWPSDRHVKFSQAPEQTLNTNAVASIAAARRLAEETGVLTPELGDHLLPIAMVEGWGTGMGVRGDQGFYASRRFLGALEKMGLKENEDYRTYYKKGEKFIMPGGGKEENMPRMAAVILGEKASLKHVKGDLLEAIKAYNGKGKATEYVYGDAVPADVDVYLAKVQAARRLLDHPLNAKFNAHFMKEYGQ